MAAMNKERPNLKICIDNVDANSDVEVSENDEDEVVIDTNVGDDSSFDGNNESEEEERYKLAAVAKVTAKARRERPILSATSPFRESVSKHRGKDRKEKSDQRSKRYERDDPLTKEELEELYNDLAITDADLRQDRSARGVRLNTVHVRVVEDMNTADMLKYFKGFDPGNVEWIDDNACNVQFSDKESAARAIINLSVSLPQKILRKKEEKKPPKEKREKKKTKRKPPKKITTDKIEKKEPKSETKVKVSKKPSPPSEQSDDDELNLMDTDEEDDEEKKTKEKEVKESKKEDGDKKDEKEEKKKVEDEEEEGELKEEKMDTESESSSSEDSEDEDSEDQEEEMEQDIPTGKWRQGKTAQKGQELLLRFATKDDKKILKTEKRNITGLTSESRKHTIRSAYMDQAAASEADMDDEDEDLIAVGLVPRSSRHSQMAASRIPEETRFDQHTRDAQNERLKQTSIKDRLKRRWSGDDNDESRSSDGGDEIVDIDELLAPPKPKRTMRMYADDVEEEIKTKRMQIEYQKQNAPPKRDIRSRLQLDRRREDSDPEDNWEEEEPYQRSHIDYDFNRDVAPRIPPPRREPMLWRDRDELTEKLDPRALEQQNQVWNRNPDWDQDRYKDLDAPEDDDDGIFGFAAPKEEFGVEVVDLKKRIKEVVDKDREEKTKEKSKNDDDDMFKEEGEEEEEDDEDQFGKVNRKDWRLKSEAKTTGGDLRSKLKRRTEPW